MTPPSGAISLAQAARLSGYHQDYLGQLCRAGKLSATKIGRTWFTTEQAVRDFLRSLQGQPVSHEAEVTPSLNLQKQIVDTPPSVSNGPRVVENVVISEVAGLPITLQATPRFPRMASLDSVITRVRLEQVQRDLTRLTGVVEEIAEQVAGHTERIDQLQTTGIPATFKHSYIPSLEVALSSDVQTLPNQSAIIYPELTAPLSRQILIISSSVLAIALVFVFVTNSVWQTKFFGNSPVASQTILQTGESQVAGDTVIVPATVSGPSPIVNNSNSSLQQVPPAPTSPGETLGGVEAGELLQ